MTSEKSMLLKFTNNSGKSLIMTMMKTNLSGGSNGGVSNFDNSFIQLIPDGATNKSAIIPNGASVTFTMDWTSTFADGKSFPTSLYPLVAMTSDDFIPVWTKAVTKNYDLNPPALDPCIVDANVLKAFNEAVNFIQQYQAYPNSTFANSFNKAYSAVNAPSTASGGSASSNNKAMDTAVNNFFAGTKSAKDVTLDMFLSAQGYYSKYPFFWATSTKTTYYLYSSKSSGVSNVASYVGTLVINEPTTKDWTKASDGYTMTFDGAKTSSYLDPTNTGSTQNDYSTVGSPSSLSYALGQFIDTPNQDVHSIALQGMYALQSTLTGQSGTKDSKIGKIVPIIVGTVNGNQVIGYPNAIKGTYKGEAPGSSDPFLYNLIHPKGVGGVIQSIMEIGGMLTMLDFAWQKIKARKEANNKSTEEAKSKAEAESGASKAKEAEAKYTEEDLAKAKSDGMAEAKAQFENNAKSEGISEKSSGEIIDKVSKAEGSGTELGDSSGVSDAMGSGIEAAETSGKYGGFIEKANKTSESLSETAGKLELIEEEGVDVSEQICGLEESAGILDNSVTDATSAIDKVGGGVLDGSGSKIKTEYGDAVSPVESETGSISETLDEAATKVAESPGDPGGAGSAIEEAQGLNKELEDGIAEDKATAESVDKVNEGEEDPAEGEGLPFEDI